MAYRKDTVIYRVLWMSPSRVILCAEYGVRSRVEVRCRRSHRPIRSVPQNKVGAITKQGKPKQTKQRSRFSFLRRRSVSSSGHGCLQSCVRVLKPFLGRNKTAFTRRMDLRYYRAKVDDACNVISSIPTKPTFFASSLADLAGLKILSPARGNNRSLI